MVGHRDTDVACAAAAGGAHCPCDSNRDVAAGNAAAPPTSSTRSDIFSLLPQRYSALLRPSRAVLPRSAGRSPVAPPQARAYHLFVAAARLDLDLPRSWMVGDCDTDAAWERAGGVRAVRIANSRADRDRGRRKRGSSAVVNTVRHILAAAESAPQHVSENDSCRRRRSSSRGFAILQKNGIPRLRRN